MCALLNFYLLSILYSTLSLTDLYTVSQKNCTPKAGRHKFSYFPNTKKSEIYVL